MCRDCWHIKNEKRGRAKSRYNSNRWSQPLTPEARLRIYNMVGNARKRGGNLKVRDIVELCLDFCKTHYHVWAPGHPFSPSIDRLDNNKGYYKDNIRIVWHIENLCRNRFSIEDVDLFCRLKLGLPSKTPLV